MLLAPPDDHPKNHFFEKSWRPLCSIPMRGLSMHRRPTQGKTLVTNQYAELRVAYWFVANGISITPTIIKLLDKYFFPVLSLSLRVNYWIYLTLFLGGGGKFARAFAESLSTYFEAEYQQFLWLWAFWASWVTWREIVWKKQIFRGGPQKGSKILAKFQNPNIQNPNKKYIHARRYKVETHLLSNLSQILVSEKNASF